MNHTLLRPHWRPTHDATPRGFDRWIAPDGANGWVKILNPDGHLCRQVWAVAPEAKIVLRLHAMSEEKGQMNADPVGTARRHAQEWLTFVTTQGLTNRLDQLAFEGINEPSWEPPHLPPVVKYTAAFVELMAGRGMTPCALQMNTGWPTNHSIPNGAPDWTPFEPVRFALQRFGGYLSVHEYSDRRGPASDDWLWNMGRIFQIPDSWADVPVLVTECGYDQAVNAPPGTPNHGWRGHMPVDEYMAQLTEYDRRMRHAVVDYPTKPKVEALFVFTHDFDKPWGTFDTVPLTDRLCLHAEWVRHQPPVVPGPRPPAPPPLPPPPVQPPPPVSDTWQRSLAWVLKQEGGFQKHPDDSGNYYKGVLIGTKYGISAASWGGQYDIPNLTLEQAKEIYFTHYWQASGADKLPWPSCLLVLDTAILHGVSAAKTWLREVGPNPFRFAAKRQRVYTRHAKWHVFGAGWVNRMSDLMEAMGE